MTYELANELKEAGFLQIGDNQDGYANDGGYEPTLSELIEACGDIRMSLIRKKGDSPVPGRWYVITDIELPKPANQLANPVFYSDTPEEVIANLWLALNKK